MADEFCLNMPDFHLTFRALLHAVNLRHGTDGFTSPPKEGVLRIFFALKNPTASVGFEPANMGTKGQHATSRPPKPHTVVLNEGSQKFVRNWKGWRSSNSLHLYLCGTTMEARSTSPHPAQGRSRGGEKWCGRPGRKD